MRLNRERDSIDKDTRSVIQNALQRTFSPEFLNRIDDVVIFNSLEQNHIFEIIDIAMRDLYKRLEEMGYKLQLSDEAKKFLSEKGYDPKFGARPLHRAIQKYLEDPLAEFILNDKTKEGVLVANLDTEKELLTVERKVAEKEEA